MSFIDYNDNYDKMLQTSMCRSVLLQPLGVGALCDVVQNPVLWAPETIYKDVTKWLKSLIVFPIDLNANVVTSVGELFIGNIGTSIPAASFNTRGYFYLGQYKFNRYFNDFSDYDGYTHIKIWLPFYDFVEISPSDVLGKYLQFRIKIDYITGYATYILGVSDNFIEPRGVSPINDSDIIRVISTYNFQLGTEIPITTTNMSDVTRNLLMTALSIGVSGAFGAANAGAQLTGFSTENKMRVNQSFNKTTGRSRITSSSETAGIKERYTINKGPEEQIFNNGIEALNHIAIRTSSAGGGVPNTLNNLSRSIQIIIYRPKFIPITNTYNFLMGKPLGETHYLKNLSGYTEVSSIHLEGVGFGQATSSEMLEIEQELSNGVII